MSLTRTTSSIGTMVASNMPALGTPHLFRRWKMFGNSWSRAMRNWIMIRSTIAVFVAESSSRANTMLTMMPKACPSAGPSRAADEDFSHVAQHVIAHTLRAGRIDIAVDGLQSAERVHSETEQRGEETD